MPVDHFIAFRVKRSMKSVDNRSQNGIILAPGSVGRLIRLPATQSAHFMEQEVYRHVPYDIEVEQALLGAIPGGQQGARARVLPTQGGAFL